MDYLVDGFKRLLNLKEEGLDDEDKQKFEIDVRNYTEIINSAKFADSNTNTEPLEKLVSALKASEESKKAKEEIEVPPEDVPEIKEDEIKSGRALYRQFLDRHLELLKHLEGEYSEILPADPLHKPQRFGKDPRITFRLPLFRVPQYIYKAIDRENAHIASLSSPLSIDTYVRKFKHLLWVEEAHQAIEMHRYDLFNVMLANYSNSFLLPVPGLAEGRPSLMKGDRLILDGGKRSTKYEGYIQDVRENDIIFRVHSNLQSSNVDGLRFNVTFLQSRTPFRRCQFGVQNFEGSQCLQQIIFPVLKSTDDLSQPKINVSEESPEKLRCFMKCLNTYQRAAVLNILKNESRPAPYIVFGPPGTGKTITLIEAIFQIYARNRSSKILVCGNSNACADLIADRLKSAKIIRDNELVRLSAFYRMESLIPEEIQDITMDFDMLSLDIYSKVKILVTTCIQAGTLYEFEDRFDYVFIDEAGHANEPEALIAIGLLKLDGSVVLAGDFQQLGPVCTSKIAGTFGLETSLLERLSRRSAYQKRLQGDKMAYDALYLTKLLISYRSDPRVLEVNNRLFYNNELKFVLKTPKKWMDLLKINHPLVFHPVRGKDRREYLNPSWFNPNEALTCLGYVNRLYGAGLKPEQLGIITPYRRQIDKLYLLFDKCGLGECKIATMEEFQGDEREVIIISTVRTRQKNLALDKQFNLGFLFNPKRFNVAVSRAKWLCIVIGDPNILKQDSCWVKYMEAAHKVAEEPQPNDEQNVTNS